MLSYLNLFRRDFGSVHPHKTHAQPASLSRSGIQPDMTPRTDLCYVISHGFAARMVMQSTILERLRSRGLSVAIAVPDATDETVRQLADRHGIALYQTPTLDPRKSYRYLLLRRYFYEDIRQNPALWSKHLAYLASEPFLKRIRIRLYYLLNRLAVRLPGLRRLISRIEGRFLKHQGAREILRTVGPRILVSTYPVEPLEALFLQEARRLGIPTVGHLLSWDNVTTKGRFAVPPDTYIAWGPIMRREIQEFYGIRRAHIYECGVAHFDHHFAAPSRDELENILLDLGLNPTLPYAFFGMSSPFISPYEIEVVEWLASAVRNGRFGDALQLVVRPHPQNVRGYTADESWLPRLRALKGPRVAVDFPLLEDSNLMWSMTEGDLPRLSNLLSGCAVCLNSGSTLAIDAIVLDRPVVMTAFDAARTGVPWWKSASRTFRYRYMKTLTDLGGTSVAYSFEELEKELRLVLADPSYREAGRERTRREECGPCDGEASRHVVDALVHILETVGGKPRALREALVAETVDG